METVTKEKELKVVTKNKVGMLAEVTALVADKGVNIDSICCYAGGDKAMFFLITNDNVKAKAALSGKGFQIDEEEAIVLRLWNRPGSLAAVTAKVKKNGINLNHVYGTSSQGGERITMVFSSDDNDKAMEVFAAAIIEE